MPSSGMRRTRFSPGAWRATGWTREAERPAREHRNPFPRLLEILVPPGSIPPYAFGRTAVQTKKIINDGNKAVDEMLEGVLAAHSRHLRRVDGSPRSVVAVDGPRPGKVGIVVGGGSGHEPTFLGFV